MLFPGWNSLSATSRYHNFFVIAGIVFLALLVFSEILAYVYEHRREHLVNAPRVLTLQEQEFIADKVHSFKGIKAVLGAVPSSAENVNFAKYALSALKKAEIDAFINLKGVEASVSPESLRNEGRLLEDDFPSGIVALYMTGNQKGEAFANAFVNTLNSLEIFAVAKGDYREEWVKFQMAQHNKNRNDPDFEPVVIVVGNKPNI